MQRRIYALAAALAVSTLAACSDTSKPTPTDPLGLAAVNATMSVDGCVDQTLTFAQVDAEVSSLITNLFEGTHEQSTFTMWSNLKKDKLESRPLLNHINNLTGWTLEKLAEGALLDPDGSGLLNATTGSVRLLDLVFRCSGETPTQVPEPPPGFNAAFELVSASTQDQQFNTSEGDAGAFLPGGSLEDNTLLVLVEQPPEVQVNTPFPKLSPTVDIALAGGKLHLNQRLTVLVCPLGDLPTEVYARGVLAHQRTAVAPGAPVGEGVEYLDPPQGGNIVCPHDETASAWRNEKGFFKRNAMHLASLAGRALSALGPRSLYAGHAALGGSLGGFSPVVAVDPYLVTEIVITPIAQPLTFGDVTNVQARLRVADVPANPAVYRGQWVNPDAVTTDVNFLDISAHIDAGAPVTTQIDNTSFANWSFPCVDAGPHTATVDFPHTLIPANAPVYGASTASANFVVNPRDLTVTAASPSRVYGNPNVLTGTLVGVQTQCDPAADITPTYTTTATQTSPVGTYPITAGVVFNEAGGNVLAANYNVISVGGTLTITPRTLLGTIDDKSKEQGDANPPFTGSVTNTVAGDGFVVTYSSTATTGSPVGTYPITLDLSVAGGSNYLWGGTNGTLTVTPDIPDPVLAFRHTEQIEIGGNNFHRYHLTVTNRSAYPASMFSPAPDLPPCGANTNASQSWVTIYNAGGTQLNAFCALGSPDDLNLIWFSVPAWQDPPAQVYITILDRRSNQTYTSNLINLYGPLFTNFPREVLAFGNNAVPGAATYQLEVQYCESWTNPDWRTCNSAWQPHSTTALAAGAWSHTFTFVGDQPGRWRVVARDAEGAILSATAYELFTYITGPGAP